MFANRDEKKYKMRKTLQQKKYTYFMIKGRTDLNIGMTCFILLCIEKSGVQELLLIFIQQLVISNVARLHEHTVPDPELADRRREGKYLQGKCTYRNFILTFMSWDRSGKKIWSSIQSIFIEAKLLYELVCPSLTHECLCCLLVHTFSAHCITIIIVYNIFIFYLSLALFSLSVSLHL